MLLISKWGISWKLKIIILLSFSITSTCAFSTRATIQSSIRSNTSFTTPSTVLRLSLNDDNKQDDDGEPFWRRFTNPILDDPYLPLSDVATAQIVAPTLQVFWISLVHAPSPTWLRPVFDNGFLYQTRGSLMAPTLVHGAGLACCWLLGALSSRAYESMAFNPTIDGGGYGSIVGTLFKAGAFATGILIFSTQMDLLIEFGRFVQPGESGDTDLRLLTAIVEVLNDIVFEAGALVYFRLYLAASFSKN
jgi:hypothetical protein